MKKKNLFLASTSCLFLSLCVFSQPYLDLAKVSYTHNPKQGLNKKTNPAYTDLYSINLTLPVELQKNGDAIIINPFFDHNKGKISNRSFSVISQGASLGFLNKLKKTSWSIYTAFILRKNKEAKRGLDHDWQYGAVALASHEKNEFITLKFGLYYNKEFFGNYFMPLAGLYWKINKKNNLFGVLPGNMNYEHKINERFYYGAIFRAATNSYRRETIDPCFSGDCGSKNYLRIDENQLGLFMDIYLSKNIVLSGESGYTLLRRYRFGTKGEQLHSYTNYRNDNIYFKLSISYRMRFN
jgi:hypothetical protein